MWSMLAMGALAALSATGAWVPSAFAQAPGAPLDVPQPAPGFLLDRFAPAVPGSEWFGAESLDFRGNVRPAFQAVLSQARDPFVIRTGEGEAGPAIVGRQMFLHLGLALNLWDHVRFAADVPLVLQQSGAASPPVGRIVYLGPGDETVGDVRATVDFKLFGRAGSPFVIAVGTHAFFPTQPGRYGSDGFVRFWPRAMVAGDYRRLSYAVNLGFLSRDRISGDWFGGDGIGHELAFAGALGARPHARLLLGAEIIGYTAVTEGDAFAKRRSPIELLFGAHVRLPAGFGASVGAGPGITPSKGSPALRLLARLQWVGGVVPDDSDADGIPDETDACPLLMGVRTTSPGDNGCPAPPDRDHDRIVDHIDACPEDPGFVSPNAAMHGCPPPRDRDGDGIFDPADACPDQAGGKTEDLATSGCAPVDGDSDGLVDSEDACPQQAGARGDDPRTTGCPDGDGDGVRDPVDICPEQAGGNNPDPARPGCPASNAQARIAGGQVQIRDHIRFRSNSAQLLPESVAVLAAVAALLKEHPEIAHVRVEGHTDNRGGKMFNQRLSVARAAAVKRWLTSTGGIAAERVSSVGLGMDRPLPDHADNASAESRSANRRVEFHIARPVPDGP